MQDNGMMMKALEQAVRFTQIQSRTLQTSNGQEEQEDKDDEVDQTATS